MSVWSAAIEMLFLVSYRYKISTSVHAANCALPSDTNCPNALYFPAMSLNSPLHLLSWKTRFFFYAGEAWELNADSGAVCLSYRKPYQNAAPVLHFLRHWINPIGFQDTIHKRQDAFEKPLHRTDSTYQSPRMLPETFRRHRLTSGFDQLTRTLLLTTAAFRKSFGPAHSRWDGSTDRLLKRRVYPTVYTSAWTHLQPSPCTLWPPALPIPSSPCYFSFPVP